MSEGSAAAFIIPTGASRELGSDGWEFDSPKRISSDAKELLVTALNLNYLESYLGIECYAGGNVKMSVVLDDHGDIENIHFQLAGNAIESIREVCKSKRINAEAELFVP